MAKPVSLALSAFVCCLALAVVRGLGSSAGMGMSAMGTGMGMSAMGTGMGMSAMGTGMGAAMGKGMGMFPSSVGMMKTMQTVQTVPINTIQAVQTVPVYQQQPVYQQPVYQPPVYQQPIVAQQYPVANVLPVQVVPFFGVPYASGYYGNHGYSGGRALGFFGGGIMEFFFTLVILVFMLERFRDFGSNNGGMYSRSVVSNGGTGRGGTWEIAD